jgi:hypothetical protein
MATIPMIPVTSSLLLAIGWEDNVMAAQFKGGKIYHYQGVPKDLYEQVLNAASPGSEFLREVRDVYVGELQ